jgi:hypothetical protein
MNITSETRDMPPTPDTRPALSRVRDWMRADVTVTLPGWALLLGTAAAVALVLVALD